jgi:flagellar L-ring protein precursor FlgH
MIPLFAAALLLPAAAGAQNLFKHRKSPISLIADHRAAAIGDILTVVVKEAHKVKNEDKVERTLDSMLRLQLEAYTLTNKTFKSNVLPELDVRRNQEFDGEAKQEKDANLEARIAVIVIDVHPNGNLVVAGTRLVRIDDEEKTLRISGIVRTLDVTKDNTVASSQIADARVALTGEGANTRTVTRGPVGTLFDTLMWAVWPF